jgi:hypothetical protein
MSSMTAADFYKLVLALWGEDWRPELYDLLRKHGHRYSRQTFYNWQKDNHPIPEPVVVILNKEAKRKEATISEPTK